MDRRDVPRDEAGLAPAEVVKWFTGNEDSQTLINNRQNGRRRGRGGPQVRNGSGNGPERGNRIDNRARGNAAQLHEKYRNLARDAQTQGDRVMTEYYLQFADHYFRVLSEGRARFEEQNPNQSQQRRQHQNDDFEEGFEGEPGDENGEGEIAPRRFDRDQRREAAYEDGERPSRQGGGDNAYNRDGQQQGRDNRDGQQSRGNRENQYGRDNRGGDRHDGRNSQQVRFDRDEPRQQREPFQAREVASADTAAPLPSGETEAPRPRRGRPRNTEPVATNGDGGAGEVKAQIEVDRLPPAFALEAPEPAPAPRTRRKSAGVVASEPEIHAVEGEPTEPAPRRRRVRREPTDDSNVAA